MKRILNKIIFLSFLFSFSVTFTGDWTEQFASLRSQTGQVPLTLDSKYSLDPINLIFSKVLLPHLKNAPQELLKKFLAIKAFFQSYIQSTRISGSLPLPSSEQIVGEALPAATSISSNLNNISLSESLKRFVNILGFIFAKGLDASSTGLEVAKEKFPGFIKNCQDNPKLMGLKILVGYITLIVIKEIVKQVPQQIGKTLAKKILGIFGIKSKDAQQKNNEDKKRKTQKNSSQVITLVPNGSDIRISDGFSI